MVFTDIKILHTFDRRMLCDNRDFRHLLFWFLSYTTNIFYIFGGI